MMMPAPVPVLVPVPGPAPAPGHRPAGVFFSFGYETCSYFCHRGLAEKIRSRKKKKIGTLQLWSSESSAS